MPSRPSPQFTVKPLANLRGRQWWVALSIVIVLATAGCREATQPAPAAVSAAPQRQSVACEETWDAVYLKGAHVGCVHTTITREGDEATPTVTIVSDTQLAISRYGDVAKMQILTRCVETPDGQVVRFSHQTESGAAPMVMEGHVEADRLIVTHRTTGKQTTTEIPWKADQGGFFAVETSLRRTPMQPGERRSVMLLWPGFTGVQLATATLESQQFEETKLLEGTQRLLRIKQAVHMEGFSVEGICWTNPQGDILKSQLASPQQEMYRTSRERAQPGRPDGRVDLGYDTVIHVATELRQPLATTRAVYEAVLKTANPAEVFVSGASQQVAPVDDRRARITVSALRPGVPREVPPESPPADADRQANALIQSDDPRVRELAAAIKPDATDPWQTSVELEKWVCRGIRSKNFSQGFATAADVAQSLEGDCTEHAVLLAALCRARGIPARVCVGLVYSPSDQGFAFHMWNEVWITDRWIPLDGTRGLGGISAAYLKLRHSNLATEQGEAAVMSVLQVMDQLQLQVVEVQ